MAFVGYNNSGLALLGQGLDAFGTSLQDIQKKQQLADLGTKLQTGDITGAAKVAFDAGDPGTGLKLMTLGLQQQTAGKIAPILGMPTDPSAAASTPSGPSVSPAPVGGFGNAVNRTLQFEGGLNPSDSNGTPSNFGINAAANPGVDVPNLSKDQAVAIYKRQYWDPLGLDNVDPKLGHVVFDTAVLAGPGKAQELMDASGGDPNKFLALRSQFLNGLVQSNPEKYGQYANAWNSRTNSLRADVNAPGGGIQVASANPGFAPQTGAITVPGYEGKFTRAQANDAEGVPSQAEWDAAARGGGAATGATGGDSTAANPQEKFLRTAQSRIIAAMAAPGLDEGTRAALKAKLDVVNSQLKDVKETSVVPLITPEDRAKYGIPATDRGVYFLKNNVPTHIGSNADSGAGKVVPAGAVLIGPDGKEVYNNKNADASLDQDTIESLAKRVAGGDTSALVGLGRGRQGAENIAAIQKRVGEIAQGLPEKEKSILQNRADQAGRMAGARTAGTTNARIDIFANEANSAMDLALETSRALPRTSYTTFNKMLQAGQTEMNDPALAAHQAQINAVANTYAKAINGGGIGTVSDKEHARSVLNAAQSPEAFEATIRQLKREVNIAHQSARSAASLRDQPVTDQGPQGAPAASVPGTTSQSIPSAIGGAIKRVIGGGPSQSAPQQGTPVPVSDQAAYQALPPKTLYQAPDGSIRIKQ